MKTEIPRPSKRKRTEDPQNQPNKDTPEAEGQTTIDHIYTLDHIDTLVTKLLDEKNRTTEELTIKNEALREAEKTLREAEKTLREAEKTLREMENKLSYMTDERNWLRQKLHEATEKPRQQQTQQEHSGQETTSTKQTDIYCYTGQEEKYPRIEIKNLLTNVPETNPNKKIKRQ